MPSIDAKQISSHVEAMVESVEKRKVDYRLIATIFDLANEYQARATDKCMLVELEPLMKDCCSVIKALSNILRQHIMLSRARDHRRYDRANAFLIDNEMLIVTLFVDTMTRFVCIVEYHEGHVMVEAMRTLLVKGNK